MADYERMARRDGSGNACPDRTFPACFESEEGCRCFDHIEWVRAVGGGTGGCFDPENAWERMTAAAIRALGKENVDG